MSTPIYGHFDNRVVRSDAQVEITVNTSAGSGAMAPKVAMAEHLVGLLNRADHIGHTYQLLAKLNELAGALVEHCGTAVLREEDRAAMSEASSLLHSIEQANTWKPGRVPCVETVSYREQSTMLAALRIYQNAIALDGLDGVRHLDHFSDAEPLDEDEVDELCERIGLADTVLFDGYIPAG